MSDTKAPGFEGPMDIKHNRGLIADPAAFAQEAGAASWLYLSGEELTVTVVPMQSDEFRCVRCFLVHHRSQLAARSDGQQICLECS